MALNFRCVLVSVALTTAITFYASGATFAQSVDYGIVSDYDAGGLGLQAEYHALPFFERGNFSAGWALGARIDGDRDIWAGVGIAANLNLTNSLFVEASLMPGYYHTGKTVLGGNLEIRSLLGIGTQVLDHSAVILSVDHMSNANLNKVNPGANAVSLRLRTRF